MSFLTGILDIGKKVFNSDIGGGLVKAALLGFAVSKLSSSANKASDAANSSAVANIDGGVRLQVPPAADEKIPVLYGSAYFGGIITEAQMSNNNKRMTYVITLSEKIGNKFSNSQATAYNFKDIYWNEQRLVFNSDGITVNYTVDRNGNIDRSLSGLVKVWCYAGSSSAADRKTPENYTNATSINAYSVVPNWTSAHTMNNLIFAVVEVNYNREKSVTGIGNMKFNVENTMSLPGDVLYDYMINPVYGAGISNVEIDTTTVTALNTYANTAVSYTDQTLGSGIVLPARYKINGLLDTAQPVQTNIEKIASAGGSWLSYDIYTGKWGVIINRSGTSVASFNDSNILGSISVSGTGLTDLYNNVKVQFPHRDLKDNGDFIAIEIPDEDRNSNEPDNTLNIAYDIINEPVQAELLGFIELKQSRVDLVIQFTTDYTNINLNAGDIIDVTNSKFGFSNRLFRIISISENQDDSGVLSIDIIALEYDSTVYDETNLYRYTRSDSTGIVTLGNIGVPGTPQITSFEQDPRPRILVESLAPTGIVEGMEFWLTNDDELAEENRSYRLVATRVPAGGGTFVSGQDVEVELDNLSSGNLLIKTRGFNSTAVGPYSEVSGLTEFIPVQTTDAISPDTAVLDELGGLATTLGIISLLNNVDDLLRVFGGEKGIFDSVKDILFPDAAGNDNAYDILSNSETYNSQITEAITAQTNALATDPEFIQAVGAQTANVSSYSIDALLDVDTTTVTPVNNDILFWNGTNWVVGRIPGVNPAPQPPKPGDGGFVPPVVPPSATTLGYVSLLPNDLADWQNPTIPADPNQAPQTGSYYIYYSGAFGSSSSPVYAPLAKGSGSARLYKSNGTLVATVAVASMTINNNRLEIPFPTRESGTNYYVLMDAGVVTYCGKSSPAITTPTFWNFNTPYYLVDAYSAPAGTLNTLTPPTLPNYASTLTVTGTGYSSGSCPGINFTLTFSETVVPAAGVIQIIENGSLVATVAGTSGTSSGTTINYGPISALEYGKSYTISVPTGVANTNRPDASAFACSVYSNIAAPQVGSTSNTFNFSTSDGLALSGYALVEQNLSGNVITALPYDSVSIESNLVLNFNRAAFRNGTGALNISIYEQDGTLHQTFNLNSNFNGTSDFTSEIINFANGSSSITLNPTKDFKTDTNYYCIISSNILKDSCGAAFAGVTSPSAITWKTVGWSASQTTPPNNASGTTVNDTGINLSFPQNITPGAGRLKIFNSANVLIANISSTNGNITYS
jgi:hypothetical protein